MDEEGDKEIDAKVKQIQGSATAIADTLVSVSQLFAEAESRVKTELNNGKQENVEKKGKKAAEKVRNDADAKLQAGDRPQTSNRTQTTNRRQNSQPNTPYANIGAAMSASITSTVEKDPIEETKKIISDYNKGENIKSSVLAGYLEKIDPSYNKFGLFYDDEVIINDARKILKDNGITDIKDGVISQNGTVVKIDNQDQILAAKEGGPVDKIFDTFKTEPSVSPIPMPYDTYVKENPYTVNTNNGDKIEVAPIEIRLSGNIQLSGGNGTVDITQQITNDPNFIRELSQMISKQFERQINGGRVSNAL